MMIEEKIRTAIRDVPNFPKEGIIFKDITPIMMDASLSKDILEHLRSIFQQENIDAIAGIESRGFLFGYPLAMALGVPFIMIRKVGKLPYDKISHSYELEYGSATIEMHTDAVKKGQRILIHDDLLATGGSAAAAARLIQQCGGQIAGFNFLVGLDFLNGKDKLQEFSPNITNLVAY